MAPYQHVGPRTSAALALQDGLMKTGDGSGFPVCLLHASEPPSFLPVTRSHRWFQSGPAWQATFQLPVR